VSGLLTDVVMPRMSGPDLAEQVAALRPAIKVLFMSGYPGGATPGHGGFASSARFLQKPFPMDTLARMLRQVLDPGDPPLAIPAA